MTKNSEAYQPCVDEMALAICETEALAERLMVRIGELAKEVRAFRKSGDISVLAMGDVYGALAYADNGAAQTMQALNSVHTALEDVRADQDLPTPGPVPTSGGGGGK